MLYLVPFAVTRFEVVVTAVEMLIAVVLDAFTVKVVANKKARKR